MNRLARQKIKAAFLVIISITGANKCRGGEGRKAELRQADWNNVFVVTPHKRGINSEIWREGEDRDGDERCK